MRRDRRRGNFGPEELLSGRLAAGVGFGAPGLKGGAAGKLQVGVGEGLPSETVGSPTPLAGSLAVATYGRSIEFGGSVAGASDPSAVVVIAGVSYTVIRASLAVPANSRWEVMRLCVTDGSSPFAVGTHAGNGWVFCSNSDSDFSVAAWRDTFASVPLVAFYSANQFVGYDGQRVTFLVANASSASYSFSGTALQTPYSGAGIPVVAQG